MGYGQLAQLVEHPLDVRRVSGSSPLLSTTKDPLPEGSGSFPFPKDPQSRSQRRKRMLGAALGRTKYRSRYRTPENDRGLFSAVRRNGFRVSLRMRSPAGGEHAESAKTRHVRTIRQIKSGQRPGLFDSLIILWRIFTVCSCTFCQSVVSSTVKGAKYR